jgi:hypothetical protein
MTHVDPQNMAALARRRAAAQDALDEQQRLAAEAERLAAARATTKTAKAIKAEADAADAEMRAAITATVERQRARATDLVTAQDALMEAVHTAALAAEEAQGLRGSLHAERRRLLAPLQQAVADAEHGSPAHKSARQLLAATEARLAPIPRTILRGSERAGPFGSHLDIRAAVATISSLDQPVGRGAAVVNQARRNRERLAVLDVPADRLEGGADREAANASRLADLGVS